MNLCLKQISPTGATQDKEVIKEKKEDDHQAQEEGCSHWPCQRVCHTHERAIPIQPTVEALDMTEEGTHRRGCAPIHQTLFLKVEMKVENQKKKYP